MWTLDYEDDQVPLIAGRRATELYDYNADWPTRIQMAASRFRTAWNSYIAAEAANTGSGAQPNRVQHWYPLVQILGSGTAPSGILRNAIAIWLFNRIAADEDATDPIKRPILRKVETVAPVSNVRASNTDTERVLRYAALINREATLPAAALLNLAQISTRFPYWLKNPRCAGPPSRASSTSRRITWGWRRTTASSGGPRYEPDPESAEGPHQHGDPPGADHRGPAPPPAGLGHANSPDARRTVRSPAQAGRRRKH